MFDSKGVDLVYIERMIMLFDMEFGRFQGGMSSYFMDNKLEFHDKYGREILIAISD